MNPTNWIKKEKEWSGKQLLWTFIGLIIFSIPTVLIDIFLVENFHKAIHIVYYIVYGLIWTIILISYFISRKPKEVKKQKQIMFIEQAMDVLQKYWTRPPHGKMLVNIEGETIYIGQAGQEIPVLAVGGINPFNKKYYYMFINPYTPKNFTVKGDYVEQMKDEEAKSIAGSLVTHQDKSNTSKKTILDNAGQVIAIEEKKEPIVSTQETEEKEKGSLS